MKKTVATAIIIFFTAASLAGCTAFSSKNKDAGQKPPAAETQNKNTGPAPGENKPAGEAPKSQDPGQNKEIGLKRDSGRYVGQIDNNFIEIKISGVPENLAAKSFMLSEKVKGEFEKYGLKKDDVVQFSYIVNSNKQNVISEIKKIEP